MKNDVYMQLLKFVTEDHPEVMRKKMADGNQNLGGGSYSYMDPKN